MTDIASLVKSITGLTEDSRAVKSGFLFAAFKGEKADGRDFIPQAIENGASVILTDTSLRGGETPTKQSIEYIFNDNPRQTFAHIAAVFYGKQPAQIAAVTGTNGKTSTVHFAQQLWEMAGLKAASLGTLQGAMTTPSPVALHENLAKLADDGITHLAMEASSHGLHQYRLDGVNVKAAGFTNLSRDHLDYHKDMEEYFTAKARLFTDILAPGGTTVINADNAEGQKLIKMCKAAGHNVWIYGRKGIDLTLKSLTPEPKGQHLSLEIFGDDYELTLPLVGEFQVYNALCALGLVLAEQGVDQTSIINSLENLHGAPGRLQFVGGHPEHAAIYVDYAHTPDALENVLTALRPHTNGKLVCVFGCGGDRDTGKRPVMGEISTRLADETIVTDDNPRSEDPATIRAAIMTAAKGAIEIEGRRAAITHAVSMLHEGDVLLVAGKGHEQGQIFATRTDPFDDVTEVKTAIQTLTQTQVPTQTQSPKRHPAT